jgi:hypothetical protein
MPEWEEKKTDETCRVEALFRTVFPQTDAYRFNSASIRVRVIDPAFEGKSYPEREEMVMPNFKKLPKRTREDVLVLLKLTPDELKTANEQTFMNHDFEHPMHSNL